MEYDKSEMYQEINRVAAESAALRDKAAIEYVMGDPNGRWFVSRLLENCHVNSMLGIIRDDGCMVMDTNAMLVQEGERRVGLMLRNNIAGMSDGLRLLQLMEVEEKSYNDRQQEIRNTIIAKYEE